MSTTMFLFRTLRPARPTNIRTLPQRPLRLQELETRTTPAGNVTANVVAGDLIILGDTNAAGNQITIQETGSGQFLIAGKAGSLTTVNGVGAWSNAPSTPVTRDLKATFLANADEISYVGIAVPLTTLRNINIDMGKGANHLAMQNFVAAQATVNMPSDSDDQTTLTNGKIRGNLSINNLKGSDQVVLTTVETTGNVAIQFADANDQATINSSLLSGIVSIINTPGTMGNTVHIDSSTIGKNLVVMSPGQFTTVNTNLFTNTSIGGSATITNGTSATGVTNNNTLTSFSVGQSLALTNGNGNDQTTMTTVRVGRSLSINNGHGDNATAISTTTLVGNGLTLRGGNDKDSLTITPGSNMFGGNTRIDNGNGVNLVSITSATFTGNFVVNGGTGNDLVSLDNSTITKNLTVNGFDGSNTVFLTTAMSISGNVTITNKMGLDTLQSNAGGGVCIGGNLTVNNGDGGSTTNMADACIEGNATFKNLAGDDALVFTDSEVSKNVAFSGGNGNQTVTFDGTTGNIIKGNCSITNKSGADIFHANAVANVVGGSLTIANGNGGSFSYLSRITVTGNTKIKNGTGHDDILTDDPNTAEYFGGHFTVDNGSGGSLVALEGSISQRSQNLGNVSITSTDGTDVVQMLRWNVFGTMKMIGGKGDDQIHMDDFTIRGKYLANLGVGNDTITIETTATLAARSNFFGEMSLNIGAGNDTVLISGSANELQLYVYGNVSGDFLTTACETRTIGAQAKRIGSPIFF